MSVVCLLLRDCRVRCRVNLSFQKNHCRHAEDVDISSIMELPRLSGPDFLLEAQRRFAFLSAFDFNVRKAEPDETGIRFEDVLLYESDCLAVLLQRSSWDGNAWITVGIPNEEYPSRAVGIAKLLKEARISHEWHSAPNTLAYLSELAEVLQTHFSDLLAGDLTLLNALWESRNRV